MSMNIGGMEAILSQLNDLSKQAEPAIQVELALAAYDCLEGAEIYAPRDLGNLENSGQVIEEPLEVTVNFDTTALTGREYAEFVENGHMSVAGNPVPAQHFLLPAFLEAQNGLEMALDDLVS